MPGSGRAGTREATGRVHSNDRFRAISFSCPAPGPRRRLSARCPGAYLPRLARSRQTPGLSENATIGTVPAPVTAVYPGSFDPITYGHLDLIARGARLFPKLVVSVLGNESKQPLFSVEERVEMLEEVVHKYPNVEVDSFAGLLVDYAVQKGASVLLRGIRAISDYEYELQMALMNRRLRPELETVFLMSGEEYSFISSRIVKEVFRLGGSVAGMVPPTVEQRLRRRVAALQNTSR